MKNVRESGCKQPQSKDHKCHNNQASNDADFIENCSVVIVIDIVKLCPVHFDSCLHIDDQDGQANYQGRCGITKLGALVRSCSISQELVGQQIPDIRQNVHVHDSDSSRDCQADNLKGCNDSVVLNLRQPL